MNDIADDFSFRMDDVELGVTPRVRAWSRLRGPNPNHRRVNPWYSGAGKIRRGKRN